MHADEFFSTALEEASAALVHHKGVLAPKLFGCGGGSGLRCDTHVILPSVTTRDHESSYARKLS